MGKWADEQVFMHLTTDLSPPDVSNDLCEPLWYPYLIRTYAPVEPGIRVGMGIVLACLSEGWNAYPWLAATDSRCG